jgi:hypothetical protein
MNLISMDRRTVGKPVACWDLVQRFLAADFSQDEPKPAPTR